MKALSVGPSMWRVAAHRVAEMRRQLAGRARRLERLRRIFPDASRDKLEEMDRVKAYRAEYAKMDPLSGSRRR